MLASFSPNPLHRLARVGSLLLFLSGLAVNFAISADLVPRFSQRNWNRSDGLPSNEVNGLCMDGAGYLWIATSAGLARFDGSRFLSYDFTPGGQPAIQGFSAIVPDPTGDGILAAPSGGGLVRLRHGRFEDYALPGEFSRRRVAKLFVAADSALWVGLEGGDVLRLHGNQHEFFTDRDGLNRRRAVQFASDGEGRVWVTDGGQLLWYEDGSLHSLPLDDINENLRIASAKKDGPWVLTRGWLRKVAGGRLAMKIQVNAGFNATSVQALLEDAEGGIWTGTRARGIRRLTLAEERSDLAINEPEDIGVLFEDGTGNIWAGSNGSGLVRVRTAVLRRFDKSQGLQESHTLSVCQDNAGTIWIANRDGGVAFINEQGRVRTLTPPKLRDTFSVRSVSPATSDGVWVATSHGLLRAQPPDLLTANPNELPQPPVYGQMRVTHMARNGDLWVALSPGRLGRLRDGSWRVFSASDGLEADNLQSIAEDSQGQLWVGSQDSKLFRFEGDKFTRIAASLLPSGAGALQAIYFDETGVCWIGTAAAGLVRFDTSTGRSLGEPQGLPTDNITQLVGDEQGSFWFGSPSGIFHVHRQELEDFFAGRINHVDAVVIGVNESLPETTCLEGYQPSIWKDRSGLVWFATRQGLIVIDPLREKVPPHPLVLNIDQVRADGVSLDADRERLNLPARVRNVELDYSVLNLSTPERVRAQFRLRGYDEDWMTADLRSPARYTRLPPGHYIFEVKAHIAGAAGTAAAVSIPLEVAAAWWQTLWFRVGVVALVLLLSVAIARTWSYRRLRNQLAQLEHAQALERERARIAQNIHDDLGSGLTRISLLTQAAESGDGRSQLDKIYRTVSGLTQSMDEIVWAVNPKNDNLENFANYLAEFAQGFLTDADIRCRVLLPETLPTKLLPAQFRHHLFLSCKEALHNVVKHARATEVVVQLRVEADRLIVTLSDNGRGMTDPAAVGQVARPGARNGLGNMRSRLTALGGTCEITSSRAGTAVILTALLSA